MKFIEFKTELEAAKHVSEIIAKKIKSNHKINLGLATGSTPITLYKCLVEDHKHNHTSWANVSTFNLDEYYGVDYKSDASYHKFMLDQLFKHVDLKLENTHFPEPKGADFDKLIKSLGGIDLQILGIGVNGHVGFNEPGSDAHSLTRIVDLTPLTIKVNADKFFAGKMNEVPKQAISMGLASIMESKEIILLAFGKDKADAIAKLKKATTFKADFPASILVNHKNITVIYDKAAGSDL